jgi:hypothetical protein
MIIIPFQLRLDVLYVIKNAEAEKRGNRVGKEQLYLYSK